MSAKQRRKAGRGKRETTPTPAPASLVVSSTPAAPGASVGRDSDGQGEAISTHLEPALFATIGQHLESQHAEGDYSVGSVAEFIRKSLLAYKDGLALTHPPGSRRSKRFSFRAGAEEFAVWEGLKSRKKAEILDRILRSALHKENV